MSQPAPRSRTFTIHFEGCGHNHEMPPPHYHNTSNDHSECFLCHPEVADRPWKGECPACFGLHRATPQETQR